MKHYTYWIIDHVNKKYYHGVHSSNAPEDIRAYHGSSRLLNEAIRHHGIDQFEKRVERVFETREEANAHEIRVHRRLDVANHPRFYNCINARPFTAVEPGPLSDRHAARLFSPEVIAANAEKRVGRAFPKDEVWRKKVSDAMKGRPLSEAHKQALRKPKSLSQEARDLRRRQAEEARQQRHAKRLAGDSPRQARRAIVVEKDARSFYVLNLAAFATAMGFSDKTTFSGRFRKILEGTGISVHGYIPRYPTDDEMMIYGARARATEMKYVEMGEGVAA